MAYGIAKLAALSAGSPQYAETGEAASGAQNTSPRDAMVLEAILEIERIQKEQQKRAVKSVDLALAKQFRLLQSKRERYERRRKNREFGLRRHRQRQLEGKRHHKSNRLWEKGTLLKHAHERFSERG